MRALCVVVRRLGGDYDVGIDKVVEHGLIEQLGPHPTDEALHKPVLHWLARCDIVPVDPVLGAPPQDRITGQFRPIVADNHAGLSTALDQGC